MGLSSKAISGNRYGRRKSPPMWWVFCYPLHGHYLSSRRNMLTTLGKFFASIVIVVSSILGIHHTQEAQPISVPLVASSTETVSILPAISAKKISLPTKPATTQVATPATTEVKSPIVTNSQSQVANTSNTEASSPVITPSQIVTPVATPPIVISLPKVKVTASPSSIAYDGTSTISWVATDAMSCTLNSSPVLLATKGNQVETPTDPTADWTKVNETTYTVACTGAGGSISGEATITIQPWVPPTGLKVLKECTFATAPCITGPNGWSCFEGSCGG